MVMTEIPPTSGPTKAASLAARLPFYYGWLVIAVAFVTMALAVNSRTSFSLFFPTILDEFGWSRGVTAGVFSAGSFSVVVMGPVFGALMDRFGPRLVVSLGACSVALGLILATHATSPVEFYATLGLMVVGGSAAASYLGHSMFLANWFVRRRGLAVGIAFSGVGVGAILVLPWLQGVIDQSGWRQACLALALIVVVVVIPLNLLVPRLRPEVLGLAADGGTPVDDHGAEPSAAAAVVDRAWAETDWTLRRAVRTARFWWVVAAYFTSLFAWYAVQVHQTKFFIDVGFGADLAAKALGLVGLFGVVGLIGLGALSDRIGREWGWTLALSGFMVCYLALIAISFAPSLPLLLVSVAGQGLLGYGLAGLYGVIASDIFAGSRFATVFAVLGLGGNLGAASGPWLMGLSFDMSGSYVPAFTLCLGLCCVSIACIWMAAPRKVRLVAGQARRRAA
jgi:MFS family permease